MMKIIFFFSDPDEIPNPEKLKNIKLKKKYGIFLQKNFNYKFNLYNKYESPWEGTRVSKKKDLKSIDYLRQKILRGLLFHQKIKGHLILRISMGLIFILETLTIQLAKYL